MWNTEPNILIRLAPTHTPHTDPPGNTLERTTVRMATKPVHGPRARKGLLRCRRVLALSPARSLLALVQQIPQQGAAGMCNSKRTSVPIPATMR